MLTAVGRRFLLPRRAHGSLAVLGSRAASDGAEPLLPFKPPPSDGSVLSRVPRKELKLNPSALIKAKTFLGYQQRATHPESYQYLVGTIGGGHAVIDPDETLWAMRKVLPFLKKVVFRGGRLLFVSSDPTLARLTRVVGEQTEQFYLSRRWVPGILTNWGKGRQHILNMLDVAPDETGRIKRARLNKAATFLGVRDMTRPPDVIVVLDGTKLHSEPAKLDIPVVGVVDTDATGDYIDYPIPANTKSLRFHHTLAHMLVRAVNEGRALRDELETYAHPDRERRGEDGRPRARYTRSGENDEYDDDDDGDDDDGDDGRPRGRFGGPRRGSV